MTTTATMPATSTQLSLRRRSGVGGGCPQPDRGGAPDPGGGGPQPGGCGAPVGGCCWAGCPQPGGCCAIVPPADDRSDDAYLPLPVNPPRWRGRDRSGKPPCCPFPASRCQQIPLAVLGPLSAGSSACRHRAATPAAGPVALHRGLRPRARTPPPAGRRPRQQPPPGAQRRGQPEAGG